MITMATIMVICDNNDNDDDKVSYHISIIKYVFCIMQWKKKNENENENENEK